MVLRSGHCGDHLVQMGAGVEGGEGFFEVVRGAFSAPALGLVFGLAFGRSLASTRGGSGGRRESSWASVEAELLPEVEGAVPEKEVLQRQKMSCSCRLPGCAGSGMRARLTPCEVATSFHFRGMK